MADTYIAAGKNKSNKDNQQRRTVGVDWLVAGGSDLSSCGSNDPAAAATYAPVAAATWRWRLWFRGQWVGPR
jgi:hypothetical protein